jgi:hypothetical protein
MPWVPELFAAPALQHILDERRRDALVAVPYFDGLVVGDPDPLVESFAGEPEVHDPVRGRIKGVAPFRDFVIETSAWLREHKASIEDVEHVVLGQRGFEEVVLHLDTDRGVVDLPVAVVADRRADGRIEELRVYFSSGPLAGRHTSRLPLLQPDPSLFVPDALTEALSAFYEPLSAPGDATVEACALVDGGRACALEYNVVPTRSPEVPRRAGVAAFTAAENGGRAAALRVYDDIDPQVFRA